MTLNNLIDKAGDWNPQLFRELKERLKLKNIGLATGASVLIQGFAWFYFYSQLPVAILETKNGSSVMAIVPKYSRYCLTTGVNDNYRQTDLCTLNPLGGVNIHWQHWWSDLFQCMSWILPLGLIVGAVYLLVADLVQEEKRGTLNFIRLSPQSAQTIFMGKILGIPILVYLAAAVMLPFHLFAGIAAGGNIPLLAAWYLTIGSLWFLCPPRW
jgi:ABC-type transport system involved in multi-copper enzyme maturation permease subunit